MAKPGTLGFARNLFSLLFVKSNIEKILTLMLLAKLEEREILGLEKFCIKFSIVIIETVVRMHIRRRVLAKQ